MPEIDHPSYYGGADNPYEAIKVIEAWQLDFHLGNAIKYICRAGRKGDRLQDLQKARWYLDRAIQRHVDEPSAPIGSAVLTPAAAPSADSPSAIAISGRSAGLVATVRRTSAGTPAGSNASSPEEPF